MTVASKIAADEASQRPAGLSSVADARLPSSRISPTPVAVIEATIASILKVECLQPLGS